MRGDGVHVLVVGAGIAGLASARTLHEWGATVEVIDRQPAPPLGGTGIFLPGNSVRALGLLGIGSEVARRAIGIDRQQTLDHRGRTLFEIETDSLWHGVAPCLALHRADLHRVLLTGLGDISVRWAASPEAVTFDDAGVTVTVDGTPSRYDLVLGADGVHSTVRHLTFGPGAVQKVGQWARRFVVKHDVEPATWSVRLGRGSAFLTIPIGEDQVYCYVDGPLNDHRSLRDLLAGYADPVPSLLDALDAHNDTAAAMQTGDIEEVIVGSWVRDTVLLIGDAAHATSPNMAQGAGLAIEDAAVLAETLDSATDLGAALTMFERRRRPRTDWVREQTHRRDRARELPPALRNALLRWFGARIQRANNRQLREQP
ncbi:FAD-dependent monooxygenase [Nocardioides insulae]|uniref:FAD-dependent monooxygenase n=1 Tax=Nocardioides insulae TaxID=394734 RepID=UPI0005609EFB|nr:FAD-dependent monooxygenase [Nocardioides insulae]